MFVERFKSKNKLSLIKNQIWLFIQQNTEIRDQNFRFHIYNFLTKVILNVLAEKRLNRQNLARSLLDKVLHGTKRCREHANLALENIKIYWTQTKFRCDD